MIKIKYEDFEKVITPTMFPDGTSQVWKIGAEKYRDKNVDVIWKWENEAEMFHLMQLQSLLQSVNCAVENLVIPYMPYARQDKEVSDETTFAKKQFFEILSTFEFSTIEYIDLHSDEHNNVLTQREDVIDQPPSNHILTDKEYIAEALKQSCIKNGSLPEEADIVLVYPDAGAARRYSDMFFGDYIVMNKVREQLTGNISSLEITQSVDVNENTKFLIVDDICDGGYTFILASKALHKEYPDNEVNLYVSHGIFSKGVLPLREAGISKIFTTDSLTEFRKNSNQALDGIKIVGGVI